MSANTLPEIPRDARPHFAYTRKPQSNSAVVQYLWRWRMWLETTFAISMLEPWEKWLVCIVVFTSAFLFWLGSVRYIPRGIVTMYSHAVYYLSGQEGESASLALLYTQWINGTAADVAGSIEL
ncbi:hypothetical protein CYLTODRAFT_372520 [Cylindrobasidium torrendii FP15055 ss-10]|uniref:Uncharacterized protein n=1 Tax=Cylindrobasidium torrendii FP15055 ss-10 TaxID=1314674 RepID=A0A0D7BIR9_9AGAR|nr:hypothetical protein CYLTODRAFT_372520 [Cylindrobasidium torrendii FP15055 ss-10]